MANFSANWNASTGATGYYLDVSIDTNFGSFVTGYNNLNVGNVLTYSVNANIKAGTTYYYRVRAYNAGGTSGNSNTISLTTTACPGYATIALDGTAFGTTFTTATQSPVANLPSGVRAGHLLLAWVVTNTNSTLSSISGWTQIGTSVNNGVDSTAHLLYGAGITGSSWTFTNLFTATETGLIVITAWSGVDNLNPKKRL